MTLSKITKPGAKINYLRCRNVKSAVGMFTFAVLSIAYPELKPC